MVEIGKEFISSIKADQNKASSDVSHHLNASSGLHVLSRRMVSAPEKHSAESNSNFGGKETEDIGPIPTFPEKADVVRFVGGAAATRINVLVRLRQSLDHLTTDYISAEKIKASILEGADINSKNKSNKTAICVAAENGRLDAVTALIAAKADIEVKDQHDQTVLHSAANAGNSELVCALVNSKADLNAKNQAEKTPFDLASMTTHEECKNALKKMGAGDWTALMVAAERGDDRVEQYFYLRDCILMCMQSAWTWEQHFEGGVLTDDKRSVSNVSSAGYRCVLGSEDFVGWGVHTWELSINMSDSDKIWVGITRSMDSADCRVLGFSPYTCACDLMIAFCSDGSNLVRGEAAIGFVNDRPKIVSNQVVLFKLDMQNKTLEMSIDGGAASVANIHDSCDRIRPFICFDGPGQVTLKSQVAKLPAAFQDDVRFYSSLNKKESLWAWGAFNREAISMLKKESLWARGGLNREEIALNDLEIKKTTSYGVACAIGNEEFAKGIHSWRISAAGDFGGQNKIFVGVVRGTFKDEDLLCLPYHIEVDMIFVFSSDGKVYSKGRTPVINTVSKTGYWSEHQEIMLKLDLHKHTLEIFMNKQLTCTVSALDDRGLRPYICIEGFGSATLESRESLVMNSNSSMVSFKDRAVGLDNSKWGDEELNTALLKLPLAGDDGV